MNEWDLLKRIKEAYQNILGSNLTGIYVHGSIAFGCFCWERSDIDFLAVVEQPLAQKQKEKLIRVLLELDACAPAKGFEMSMILRSACSPFQDPTPYGLHYSNAHRANYQRDLSGTCMKLQGYDPDLAAHITIINHVGLTLYGLPKEKVFSPVPWVSYLKSLWYDIENAAKEIESDPVYYVLNLCRVLAAVEAGLVLSKEQGGEWGMERFPEEKEQIAAALAAYRENGLPPAGRELVFFAEKVLRRVCQNAVFLSACTKKD